MPPEIFILIAIIHIIGGAVAYIIVQKKKGKKCIGCPCADKCQGKCQCNKK